MTVNCCKIGSVSICTSHSLLSRDKSLKKISIRCGSHVGYPFASLQKMYARNAVENVL